MLPVAFIVCSLVGLTAALPAFNAHVCFAAHQDVQPEVAAGFFAATALHNASQRYPHLAITPKLIYENSTEARAQRIANGLIAERNNCSLLIGPGWSSLAQAISVLVDAPLWIDYSSTSTVLSDKGLYPAFARTVPHDKDSSIGLVKVVEHFGWRVMNTVCMDHAYGRSFLNGLTEAAAARGIRISAQRCFLPKATAAEVDAYLDVLERSESRIVAGILFDEPFFSIFVNRTVTRGLHKSLIFVLGDAACGASSSFRKMPGGFCTTFTTDDARRQTFETAYKASWPAVRPQVEAAFTAAGVQYTLGDPATLLSFIYAKFAVDGVLFGLAALEEKARQIVAATGTPAGMPLLNLKGEDKVAYRRRVFGSNASGFVLPDGLTGTVWIDQLGDRESSRVAIFNVQPNSSDPDAQEGLLVRVGDIPAVAGQDNAVVMQSSRMYFAGQFLTQAPTWMTSPASSSTDSQGLLLGLLAGLLGAIVVAVAVAAVVFFVRRRLAAARFPRDDTKPFAAAFVSVSNEAVLRERYGPDAAFRACRAVEAFVTDAATKEQCQVARRLDAHFMFVAKDPTAAVRAAGRVMHSAHATNWERFFARLHSDHSVPAVAKPLPKAKGEKTESTGSRSSTSASRSSRHRTRAVCATVSAGVAWGRGHIAVNANDEFDVSYSGGVVDAAASVTDQARGGQCLCDGHLVEAALSASQQGAEIAHLSKLSRALRPAALDASAHRRSVASKAAPPPRRDWDEVFTSVHRNDAHGRKESIATIDSVVVPAIPDDVDTATVFQFDAPGLPVFVASAVPAGAEESGSGALSSALQEASGRLSSRRVGIAALLVPALRSRDSDSAVTSETVLQIVAAVCTDHKAALVSAVGAHLIVAVNAVGAPVVQAASRAATVAMLCATRIEEEAKVTAFVGVHFGAASIGACSGGSGKASDVRVIANSAVAEKAALLSRVAALRSANGEDTSPQCHTSQESAEILASRVLISPAVRTEVQYTHAVVAVDVAAMDGPGTAPCALYAVTGSVEGGEEDAEWMYQLSRAEAGNRHLLASDGVVAVAAGNEAAAMECWCGRDDSTVAPRGTTVEEALQSNDHGVRTAIAHALSPRVSSSAFRDDKPFREGPTCVAAPRCPVGRLLQRVAAARAEVLAQHAAEALMRCAGVAEPSYTQSLVVHDDTFAENVRLYGALVAQRAALCDF